MLGDYSGFIDNFVNCYDVEARCAFIFTYSRFQIKIINTLQLAQYVWFPPYFR